MHRKPNFQRMMLFQLMNWVEENNYDDDYNVYVSNLSWNFNPFELAPDGANSKWREEQDALESIVKQEFKDACELIWSKKYANC